MEFRIRPYRPSDFEALFQIDQACFPPGISYPRSELRHFIRQRGSCTWVAEAGDETIGFLIACLEPENAVHLVTIDVVALWRRKGMGGALMDVAEEWARELRVLLIYLETAEDNLSAHEFYKARGYSKVEKVDRYYSNGAAAWVMAKSLKIG